ncbi:MAG: hypothetical protein ACI3YL_06580, partial [Prevotella sp.]
RSENESRRKTTSFSSYSIWNVIFRRGGKRKREIVSWVKKNGYLCRVKKQENASAGSKMALNGV